MGEARRRGTPTQRKAWAIARRRGNSATMFEEAVTGSLSRGFNARHKHIVVFRTADNFDFVESLEYQALGRVAKRFDCKFETEVTGRTTRVTFERLEQDGSPQG